MPSLGAGQSPCPTWGFQGGFGPMFHRGRRPSGDSGPYEVRRTKEQEKALALLLRLGGHFRPQCGRFQGLELALF